MSTPAVAPEISQHRKTTIEQCLRDGFAPQGQAGGKGSSVYEAARRLTIKPTVLNSWLLRQRISSEAGLESWLPDWTMFSLTAADEGRTLVVSHRKAQRWLLTSAQDDTPVHAGFMKNLIAYSESIGAEIRIAGFTYQKGLFEDHMTRTAAFRPEVHPYLFHDSNECGPLVFVANMNTLPTANRPLSGLTTHTRGRWGVFPHAKIQLESVAAMPGAHPAMLMTTGACTISNYIQKKAGIKAEFHHQIGATIVEVDPEGRTFCRQITAGDDGTFQDLDSMVKNGRVTRGHRVEEITWGDVHLEKIDPIVAMAAWGLDVETGVTSSRDNMLDILRPRHQAWHDIVDFQARNHHRRGDHFFAYKMMLEGTDRVESEMAACARFLRETSRDWCTSVVVASNHPDALPRWLRETDPRQDPINARFWCQATDAVYAEREAKRAELDVFEWAVTRHDPEGLKDVVFVPRNSSYLVCQATGGIEIAQHGDQGVNGARGSAANLNQVAVRMNIGHSHSAKILDGVYQAGLCGRMDQGYNSGPSSWSHTQVVTYPSSRRTLVTMIDGKWRA